MPALFTILLACTLLPGHNPDPPPTAKVDTATPPSTRPAPVPATSSTDALPATSSTDALSTPPTSQNTSPCEDTSLADEPLTSDCVTAQIFCGQTIEGHTSGGATGWSDTFYRKNFCTPGGDGYDGPERVYRMPTPANTIVEVTLESPCEDLDLFMLSWPETGRCPTELHALSTCEADVSSRGGSVRTSNLQYGYTYLIAVDGKAGATGPFTISTRCTPR